MDREHGAAKETLASRGIRLHPIVSMSELLEVLQEAERIDGPTAQRVRSFRYSWARPPRQSPPESRGCAIAAVPRRGTVAAFLQGSRVRRRRRRSLATRTEPNSPVRTSAFAEVSTPAVC